MTPEQRAVRRQKSIKPYGQHPPELSDEELARRCAEVRERWAKKPYLERRRNQYADPRVEVQIIETFVTPIGGSGVCGGAGGRRGGVRGDD